MNKIMFADMPRSFNYEDNFILDILRKNNVEYVISDNPDFLFYSVYGLKHYDYENCIKIFWTVEPVAPNFNECDYAVAFDDIEFGDRYFKRPIWLFEDRPTRNDLDLESLLDRKFCNFIYSQDSVGYGACLRKKFAEKLMEYKPVDCPGKILNNMSDAIIPRDGDWRAGKLDFIRNYKFTIAFENSSYPGYTTEKLTQPLMVNSMPIYWGNPLVDRSFNINSFVTYTGLEDGLDSLVERIVELDNDDNQYIEMMKMPCMNSNYNENEVVELEKFICGIIEKHVQYVKDPVEYNEIKMFVKRLNRFNHKNMFNSEFFILRLK